MIFAEAVRRACVLVAVPAAVAGVALLTVPAASADPAVTGSLGSRCEAHYLLALRGSNEPPQDAVVHESPVYPASVATGGMGPLLSAFFTALQQQTGERSLPAPAGYGIVYPAVQVGDGGLSYFSNYVRSARIGAENLRRALQQINTACADSETQVVIAGNSQGADAINLALGNEVTSASDDFRNVSVITYFGDPSRSDQQHSRAVGAQRGQGIFRILALFPAAQDQWMRANPDVTISFCIPGDNVCDPVEHPEDLGNARGTIGVTPLDRHLSYADPAVRLRCDSPGLPDETWMNAKDCAAHMVADRLSTQASS
ncbi:cutinase family protein [Hoyosella altamirensis]|uniref:Cutinase n=1 Tax=Hoyosella altamirensis TaxID=616997 RepID=A0A839RI57_9ACTN|nr:cutinase family protein [Hoyosella altamirensis]MBB3035846.1 hypothetical protein [Hoyosella altamirensis]